MRLFTVLATVLAVLGSAGIAAADCAGHASTNQETAKDNVLPPKDGAAS